MGDEIAGFETSEVFRISKQFLKIGTHFVNVSDSILGISELFISGCWISHVGFQIFSFLDLRLQDL